MWELEQTVSELPVLEGLLKRLDQEITILEVTEGFTIHGEI